MAFKIADQFPLQKAATKIAFSKKSFFMLCLYFFLFPNKGVALTFLISSTLTLFHVVLKDLLCIVVIYVPILNSFANLKLLSQNPLTHLFFHLFLHAFYMLTFLNLKQLHTLSYTLIYISYPSCYLITSFVLSFLLSLFTLGSEQIKLFTGCVLI